jgi:hypothetical protein
MAMFDGLLLLALYVLAQGLTAWAFVDALIRPAAGFVAAGKLTKPGWAVITGLAALIIFWQKSPMTLFGLPSRRSSTWSTCGRPCAGCGAATAGEFPLLTPRSVSRRG